MPIFHIDADAFFASVEQGFNPALRGRPVIVGGSEQQRGVVHTASYEARAQGIRTGMPLAEAKQLCPQAAFLKGNFQHYQAASRTMERIYRRYTPAVEFTSLDDAYLDFSGTARLYDSYTRIARQIQEAVAEALNIGVSIGIGSSKLIARIASGLQKPRGIVEVPPGGERDFLRSLPVDQVPGIGRVTREKLLELGITRIGELADLPKMVLNQLLGINGIKIWEYANAIDRRDVRPRLLPKQISRETTFEEDLTDRAIILATLQYLCERVATKLREHQQCCSRVGVKIRYSDFTQHKVSRKMPRSSDNAADIFAAVAHLVKKIPFRRLRVRHVGVQAGGIEWNNWQLQLLQESSRRQQLDEAVDDIRHKFGFTSILPADTLELRKKYRMEKNGFVLHAPALTR